jgi:hypothetical protein
MKTWTEILLNLIQIQNYTMTNMGLHGFVGLHGFDGGMLQGVYIWLSQETSRWAKIQILDNVRGAKQCPAGPDKVQ